MTAEYRRQALLALIEQAMPSIRDLESPQRAECFDGIAIACAAAAPDLALAASEAAAALRDADSRQLRLHLLLTQETNQPVD